MWSLHPPYRNAAFYERLPLLIRNIEQGEVPDGQLGDYDMNDSMVDWSSVRKRLAEKARALAAHLRSHDGEKGGSQ